MRIFTKFNLKRKTMEKGQFAQRALCKKDTLHKSTSMHLTWHNKHQCNDISQEALMDSAKGEKQQAITCRHF